MQHRYLHPFFNCSKWLENWFQQSLNIINGASNMYDVSRLYQNREIYKTALADLSLENEKNEWKCFVSRQCTNGLSLNSSVALLFGLTVQERCDIASGSKKTWTFYVSFFQSCCRIRERQIETDNFLCCCDLPQPPRFLMRISGAFFFSTRIRRVISLKSTTVSLLKQTSGINFLHDLRLVNNCGKTLNSKNDGWRSQ